MITPPKDVASDRSDVVRRRRLIRLSPIAAASISLIFCIAAATGCDLLAYPLWPAAPGEGNGEDIERVSIGGTVSGYVQGAGGDVLVLRETESEQSRPVSADGAFFFDPVPVGSSYEVVVEQRPSEPGQECTVTNSSGVAEEDVLDIGISCATDRYAVVVDILDMGGADEIDLTLWVGDDESFHESASEPGPHAFAAQVAEGSTIEIGADFAGDGVFGFGGDCDVTKESGTVPAGEFQSSVTCYSHLAVTISVEVTGYDPGMGGDALILRETRSETELQVEGPESYDLAQVKKGSDYEVVVHRQPSLPSQECAVSEGWGVAEQDVSVRVDCVTSTYWVIAEVEELGGAEEVDLRLFVSGEPVASRSADAIGDFPIGDVEDGSSVEVKASYVGGGDEGWGGICNVSDGSGTVRGQDFRTSVACESRGGRDDTVYVGTSNAGVAISLDGGVSFERSLGAPSELAHDRVRDLLAHGDELYVATFNGLSFSTNRGETIEWTDFVGLDVRCLFSPDGSVFYAGTNPGSTGVLHKWHGDAWVSVSTFDNPVLSVSVDGAHKYVGTSGGLRVREGDGSDTFADRTAGLANQRAQGLLVHEGTLYVATPEGLSVSIDQGQSYHNFNSQSGLGANRSNGLFMDTSGDDPVLYVATTGGLSISTELAPPESLEFETRTEQHGLASNDVRGVFARGPYIWVATDGGLSISADGGDSFISRTVEDDVGLGSNDLQAVYVVLGED